MRRFDPNGIVTLTTDFGTRDGYVGAMMGVMIRVSPTLRFVDLAHDVPPHDVVTGAYTLETAAPWFPAGTVHLVVVDPGVGSPRAPVAVTAGGHCFVAPDNGVLAPVLAHLGGPIAAHRIQAHAFLAASPSQTFHGRDVFAPTAAGIASRRLTASGVGPAVDLVGGLVVAPAPPHHDGADVHATVLYSDRFGNLVTNATRPDLGPLGAGPLDVTGPSLGVVPVARTYADAAPDALVALFGSRGRLELAVRNGSAAERTGLRPGAVLSVCRRPTP